MNQNQKSSKITVVTVLVGPVVLIGMLFFSLTKIMPIDNQEMEKKVVHYNLYFSEEQKEVMGSACGKTITGELVEFTESIRDGRNLVFNFKDYIYLGRGKYHSQIPGNLEKEKMAVSILMKKAFDEIKRKKTKK